MTASSDWGAVMLGEQPIGAVYAGGEKRWPGEVPPEPGEDYPDLILAADPLIYLRLNELSGLVAADSSGNGLHASYGSAILLGRPGPIAGSTAIQFAGTTTTGVVTLPPELVLAAGSPVTIEYWRRSVASAQAAVTVGNQPDPNRCVTLEPYSGGTNGRAFWDYGNQATTGRLQLAAGMNVWADGTQWYHWLADAGGGTQTLWINGQQQVTRSGHVGPVVALSGGLIGASVATATAANGGIAEVAIYPRVLSDDEKAARYEFVAGQA